MKQESVCSRVSRVIFSLLLMAIGLWVISMAIEGRTPAEPLDKPGDQIIMGIFGAMFCASGCMGIVHGLLSGNAKGPAIAAGIGAIVFVLFGLCFLSVAILQPGEIVSTSSVNGIGVSGSKGGWSGAVIFSVVGILPLILARQIYRKFKVAFEKGN